MHGESKKREDVEFGVSFLSGVSRLHRQQINDPTTLLDTDGMSSDANPEAQVQQTQPAERRKSGYDWKSARIFRLMEPPKLRFCTILACFLVPALFFMVYETDLNSTGIVRLQPFGPPPIVRKFEDFNDLRNEQGDGIKLESVLLKSKPMCDTSYERTNVCALDGDIRIHGKSSSVVYITASGKVEPDESWQIKPYPRKRDKAALIHVREVQLRRQSSTQEGSPQCTVNHTVPGIVFSGGGYAGNFYHAFTDVLLPLFLTSRRYAGDVQFLVSSRHSWWITKYKAILKQLTRYEIIDFDKDDRIHCFKSVTVGLIRYNEFGIVSSQVPKGATPSLTDFTKLLRLAFSLERDSTVSDQKQKPRLLILTRNRTRRFMNVQEVVRMSVGLGYEVVAMEAAGGTKKFARVVNSCDVMLGVHGAGLTNMLFLPANATIVQVVPWGGLEGMGRYCFRNVAIEMGLKYMEYTIGKVESSLAEMYPSDHPVFKDVKSIHNKGWSAVKDAFLRQDVKVNVSKLRVVLLEAFKA